MGDGRGTLGCMLYDAIRVLHIAAGAVGLVSMFVPLLSKKGSRLHRRVGKVFAAAMIISGVAGTVMSATQLVIPTAFTNRSADLVRINGLFLGTIGLLMLCAVQQMLRSLDRKKQPQPRPSRLDLGLPIASVCFGAITTIVGVWFAAPLLIGFGLLAALTAVGDLRFVTRPLRTPKAWWYQHMQGAMVAIISAVTAFVVFGGRHMLAELVPAPMRWVFWVAPALVLVPLFQVWTTRWRRRFGEA